MTTTPQPAPAHKPIRGRPQAASPEILQEAALELFQLNGFDETSVEEIARVAGYSRATFFNYFPTKADVFWLEIDQILTDVETQLASNTLTSFRDLIDYLDNAFNDRPIPWIFGNSWLLHNGTEILTGGVHRFLRMQSVINQLTHTIHPELHSRQIRIKSYQYSALLMSSLQNWQEDGVTRQKLSQYVEQAKIEANNR